MPAARYAGCYVVTLSVDQVMFRQPIHVGELVTFMASVNYTGNSSMEIGVKVIAEDIRTQVVRHANGCFFTMVAVDKDRKPITVPPLRPSPPKRSAATAHWPARSCAGSWSSATKPFATHPQAKLRTPG
jgi:acyl-CoA hydrolase